MSVSQSMIDCLDPLHRVAPHPDEGFLQQIANFKLEFDDEILQFNLSLNSRGNVGWPQSDEEVKKDFSEKKNSWKKKIEDYLATIPPAKRAYVKHSLSPVQKEMQESFTKLQAQVKMAKKLFDLGYDHALAFTHYDFAQFLFESKLMFWMSCFKNTTAQGAKTHAISIVQGEPCIKVNDQPQPWSYIKENFEFNAQEDKIVSKNNSKESWTYVSPGGLIQKDRFEYDTIYPIEQLNKEEYATLLEHAKDFYSTNEEQDKGATKDAVLQVVTTFRTRWWGMDLPENRLTKNLVETFPRHVTLRLVDKEGKVYSFGFEMKKEEAENIVGFLPPTILRTGTTKISVPDYEEPRPFTSRSITSVPLTTKRAEEILRFVNEQNKQGVRFNFMKQNCTKLAGETLALAGHRVDTRISFGNLFGSMMPNTKDIPVIGSPLQWVAEKIMYVVGPILNTLIVYTPQSIKSAVRYLPEKVATVLINLLILTLGGATATSELPEGVADERDNSQKLGNFSRIIRSPLDLLREDTCDINYSQAIVDWQGRQKSTRVRTYDPKAPQLHVLPT